MATKTKSYPTIKFTYEVINKAYNEFLKSVNIKSKKTINRSWEVDRPDAKWTLDSESQFIAEYVKDDILEASLLCFDLGDSKFKVNYSNQPYEKPITRISISLSDRERIEKIFLVFEASYNEFIEKSKSLIEAGSQLQVSQQYSFEKKLPSVFVDKKLVVELERYIQQRCNQLSGFRKRASDYSVIVVDSSGTLSLQSIDAYPRDVFDNDIEAVTLSYGGVYENVKIYIRFARSKDRSEIEISYNGENAREIVESLKVGIYQRLKDAKTWSFIYHPPFMLISLLVYPLLIVFGFKIYTGYLTGEWSQQGISTFLILLTYLVAPYLKPYITFDTRRNIIVRKWSGWFVESLLGILLLWLVFTLFPALNP